VRELATIRDVSMALKGGTPKEGARAFLGFERRFREALRERKGELAELNHFVLTDGMPAVIAGLGLGAVAAWTEAGLRIAGVHVGLEVSRVIFGAETAGMSVIPVLAVTAGLYPRVHEAIKRPTITAALAIDDALKGRLRYRESLRVKAQVMEDRLMRLG